MTHHLRQRPVPAPYVLPAGFAAFLAVGTVAAALHGRLDAAGMLVACAAVAGFSRPPYAQLRPTGTAATRAAVVLGVTALAGAGLGVVFRWYWRRLTLVSMGTYGGMRARRPAAEPALTTDVVAAADLPGGTSPPGSISMRRRVAGVVLAAAMLPLLTYVLTVFRPHL